MSNNLEWYHKILFIERPWMDATTTDAKYQQLLHELSTENFAQQPLYELSFPKPLTHKRKYYQALINNEAIIFINSVHDVMKRALNDNEKKYHIHKILSKKLPAKLHETEKIIASLKLYFSLIDDPAIDKRVRDNAFIIQYLKYQLICLYLEIQDSFASYVTTDILTEKEINLIYFSEPFNTFIKTNTGVKRDSLIANNAEKKKFKAIKADFRKDVPKGILSYEEIVSHPHSFANVEEELYKVQLIDEKYNFTSIHTEKQKLAAIYHVLIRKGYFIKRDFKKRKGITDVAIRKFLDHRYNAKLDSQFRHWRRNPDALASYIKPFEWIDNLPHA
jgi:hypothetical protein